MLISEQKVVMCRTHKGGKILIFNYSDHHEIMEKELNKFDVLQFTSQIMHKKFEVNKPKCKNLAISLFEKGVISKDLLYHSTDMELKKIVVKRYRESSLNILHALAHRMRTPFSRLTSSNLITN